MRATSKIKRVQQRTDGQGARWTYSRRGHALSHSIRQLKRHKLASLGTLMALGITLSLPFILYFSSGALATLSQRSVQGESLTAYLDVKVNDIEGAALAQQWQQLPDVASTQFISKDQALAILSEQTDIRGALEILQANPLPAAIIVYPDTVAADSELVESLATAIRELPMVASVQLDLRWVRRLEAAVTLTKWVGGLMAAFLTLTALLVIANTIRLELARRRDEMEVSRLLGASTHFMNRPIVYTGALYGFLGGVIACTIALFTLNAIRAPADNLSALYQSTFTLALPGITQILLVLGVSIGLGLAGAVGSLYRPSHHLTHK